MALEEQLHADQHQLHFCRGDQQYELQFLQFQILQAEIRERMVKLQMELELASAAAGCVPMGSLQHPLGWGGHGQ